MLRDLPAAARRKDIIQMLEVLLFEAGEFISLEHCEIPYVLSGEIDDYERLFSIHLHLLQEETGVLKFCKHFVQEVDTKKRQIIVKDLTENKILEHNL